MLYFKNKYQKNIKKETVRLLKRSNEQMNTTLAKKNVITSIFYQLVTVAYGLIVPRLVLSSFGSEVNGLTSSLSQFLNYINLLEGGLSGVIMAALYKPLAN